MARRPEVLLLNLPYPRAAQLDEVRVLAHLQVALRVRLHDRFTLPFPCQGERDEDVLGGRKVRKGGFLRGGVEGRVEFEGGGGVGIAVFASDGMAGCGGCSVSEVVGGEEREEEGGRPACAEDEEIELLHCGRGWIREGSGRGGI